MKINLTGQSNNSLLPPGHLPGSGTIDSKADGQKPSSNEIPLRIENIHDIIGEPEKRDHLLHVLNHLITAQASLHFKEYFGNKRKLEDTIMEKAHTLRGFVVYAQDRLPIAYTLYYPMIDHEGKRAAYCEDMYVDANHRNSGVGIIVVQEMARRVLRDDLQYLEWATDKRNKPFQSFIMKTVGATRPDTVTLNAQPLLEKVDFLPDHSKNEYMTRTLQPQDIERVRDLNLSGDIIRKTGDLPFKGFITFRKNEPNKPVAITPGWEHFSTFRLEHGVYLEHPVMKENLDSAEKEKILISVAGSAKQFCNDNNRKYLRWHVKENDVSTEILQNLFSLDRDSMEGDKESEMIVYTLKNGKLNALAAEAEARSSSDLKIRKSSSYGVKTREDKPSAQPPGKA